jgi:hypothetical protein
MSTKVLLELDQKVSKVKTNQAFGDYLCYKATFFIVMIFTKISLLLGLLNNDERFEI